jgi:hypothetical protein
MRSVEAHAEHGRRGEDLPRRVRSEAAYRFETYFEKLTGMR